MLNHCQHAQVWFYDKQNSLKRISTNTLHKRRAKFFLRPVQIAPDGLLTVTRVCPCGSAISVGV